jgi:dTDP-4-amino-4,6-dideoxygalactose transaminase
VIRTRAAAHRDALQTHLNAHGIGTMIHYPVPPHLQEAYSGAGWKQGQFPLAEAMAESVLSLPLYPGMTESDVEHVTACIQGFFTNANSSNK